MRYKYCKDGDGGAITQHRYNWIKRNGVIPEGCEIHHKNWDKYDNRMENLSLMPVNRQRRLHHFFPTLNPNSEHIFKLGFTPEGYNNFLAGLPSKLSELLKCKSRICDIVNEWDKLWSQQTYGKSSKCRSLW